MRPEPRRNGRVLHIYREMFNHDIQVLCWLAQVLLQNIRHTHPYRQFLQMIYFQLTHRNWLTVIDTIFALKFNQCFKEYNLTFCGNTRYLNIQAGSHYSMRQRELKSRYMSLTKLSKSRRGKFINFCLALLEKKYRLSFVVKSVSSVLNYSASKNHSPSIWTNS